jgi:hypothetical protein
MAHDILPVSNAGVLKNRTLREISLDSCASGMPWRQWLTVLRMNEAL